MFTTRQVIDAITWIMYAFFVGIMLYCLTIVIKYKSLKCKYKKYCKSMISEKCKTCKHNEKREKQIKLIDFYEKGE